MEKNLENIENPATRHIRPNKFIIAQYNKNDGGLSFTSFKKLQQMGNYAHFKHRTSEIKIPWGKFSILTE